MTASKTPNEIAGQAVNSVHQMLRDQGLVLSSPNDVRADLVDYFLRRNMGRSPDMDQRIRAAYAKRFPEALPLSDIGRLAPPMLVGAGGHGKSSVLVAAAREVADMVGLNLVVNPDQGMDMTNNKDNLVVNIIQLAGQTSNQTDAGLPKGKIRNGESMWLGFVPNFATQAVNSAGMSVTIYDDFGRAPENVKSGAMQVLLESTYNSLHVEGAVMASANLGQADGSYGNINDPALRGRVRIIGLVDNPDEFVARLRAAYANDPTEVRDGYFANLIEVHGQKLLDELSSTDQPGGVTQPRTLMDLAVKINAAIAKRGGLDHIDEALEEIQQASRALLSAHASTIVNGYYIGMATGAEPLARKAIREGVIDRKDVKHRWNEGRSPEGEMFAIQYAVACATWMAVEIARLASKNSKMSKKERDQALASTKALITRFGEATLGIIGESSWSQGILHLVAETASRAPWTRDKKAIRQSQATYSGREYAMDEEIEDLIRDTLNEHPAMTQTAYDAMELRILGLAQMQTSGTGSMLEHNIGRTH